MKVGLLHARTINRTGPLLVPVHGQNLQSVSRSPYNNNTTIETVDIFSQSYYVIVEGFLVSEFVNVTYREG